MWFCPRAQHSLVYTYTWPRPLTDALLGRGHSVHLLLGRGPTYTNTDNTDDSDTEQGVFIALLPCYCSYSYSYQFQFQFQSQYFIASVALHTSTIQMCWCPFYCLGACISRCRQRYTGWRLSYLGVHVSAIGEPQIPSGRCQLSSQLSL